MWVTAFPEYRYLLKGTCALHLAKPQPTCFPFPMAKPKWQPALDWNPLESTKIPQIFSICSSRSKEFFPNASSWNVVSQKLVFLTSTFTEFLKSITAEQDVPAEVSGIATVASKSREECLKSLKGCTQTRLKSWVGLWNPALSCRYVV